MTNPKRRSPCPVACALDLIGDRWTLLVVRDLACGKGQFKEFCASPEGVATNILADRLRRLTEAGLVEQRPSAGRRAYALTARGRTLIPVLEAVAAWGLANIKGTQARMKLADVPRPPRAAH
jgi:DNA-binding HxlR family transcriptional regulator